MKIQFVAIRLDTPATCEAGLDDIDRILAKISSRIVVASIDKWSPRRWVSRLFGIFWADQVTQDENHVCDSPILQVKELRSTTDIVLQDVEYGRLVNQIDRVADTAEAAISNLRGQLEEQKNLVNEDVDVDMSNSAHLGEEDREAVRKHDEEARRAVRVAVLKSTSKEVSDWEAVLAHARRSRETAVSDLGKFKIMVLSHYAQQAQDHIKWAHRRKGLQSPYLLPGALSGGVPVLFSSEEGE